MDRRVNSFARSVTVFFVSFRPWFIPLQRLNKKFPVEFRTALHAQRSPTPHRAHAEGLQVELLIIVLNRKAPALDLVEATWAVCFA